MNLAGQLVIARARFAQIGETLRHFSSNKLAARVVAKSMEMLAGMSNPANRNRDRGTQEVNRLQGPGAAGSNRTGPGSSGNWLPWPA